ncbi:MAG: hypothetical protein HYY23_02140 [Verrucomicrobia bacterium]|nr:hypothetical protein [Verrucomicrobiota bacterium]
MNKRERVLALAVGCIALLFGGVFGVRYLVIKPLQSIDRQTALLRDKLRQIHDERRAFFAAEDDLKRLAQTSFGTNADVATAHAGKMLTDLILRLGLSESEFARTPVGPRKLRGVQEVGWNVQGEGPLAKIVDLLFELEQCPQIHRLENVVLSAGDKPSRAKVRLRFLTLVVDAAPDTVPIGLKPKLTLASPERRLYDAIVQRDLFRPYLRRNAPDSALVSSIGDLPDGARPDLLKVVSLSEWQRTPEVHIMNLSSKKLQILKPGDAWAGGEIITVDYRPRSMPGKPGLLSFARVILKIGADFWAVEHGQTLAEKYQLSADALPSDLVKMQTQAKANRD